MKAVAPALRWSRLLVLPVFVSVWLGPLCVSAADEDTGIRHMPSETCGEADCHQQIYQQWKTSMHAQSTALEDPIHGMFYHMVVGDPTKEGVKKGGKYPVCLQCHSPAAAKDKKTKLDANVAYSEGVNCIACHTLTHYKGRSAPGEKLALGMQAYEFTDAALQDPGGRYLSPEPTAEGDAAQRMHIFEVEPNAALLKTSDACWGCHDTRNNPNKVPLCQTGGEIRLTGGSTTCQGCHMPLVNGIPDHSMPGGHSAKMVSQGLVMTMDATSAGDKLTAEITLLNKLPHNFPTGAPFRNFFIKVAAYDAKGNVLWQNAKQHPMKEDKQAMFMYILGDESGKPAPPPKATQVLGDSRLKPNEKRTLSYEIPAKDVALIRAVGYYDLLLPPIKEKFGAKLPEDLQKPKEVAVAEWRA